MYGIFLEEINHGVDGGLYAEMIRNRGFEDAKPPEGFTSGRVMATVLAVGWPDNTNVQQFGRFNYFIATAP